MKVVIVVRRTVSVVVLSLLGAGVGAASGPHADTRSVTPPLPATLRIEDGVRDKNFYFFRILEAERPRALLRDEPTLAALMSSYRMRITAALDSCAARASCYLEAARFTDAEIASVDSALRNLCHSRPVDCGEIAVPLRESGTMIRFAGESDADLLGDTWRWATSAINHIFATYGEGIAPRYPKIDSMSHDPASEDFGSLLQTATRVVITADVGRNAFFSDYLKFTLLLLAIDGRDEAGRHEPLENGENRASAKAAAHTAWKSYHYSVILVPGDGPDEPGVRLAPRGRLRLELAVARYRQHAAPFIAVSGGYVHPARTPFSEAIEMKRALVADYGVPENAIVVEPHARHTTTNFRNTVRLMYRYGMPLSMPALAVTNEGHATYIMQDGFEDRNRLETGIVPYQGKKRVSPVEIEFMPSTDALQVGFEDPLDP